jgi:hypothetical protein
MHAVPGKHIYIPDIQARPGEVLNHCEWIGKYIEEKQPTVVINAGDHCDVSSLSSWDRGKLQFEGRRFSQDIEASHLANDMLLGPIFESGAHEDIELHITVGNHENRIALFAEKNPELAGFVDIKHLEYEYYYHHVHDFLVPVTIDGVTYAHYFYNPMTGKPWGGMIETRIKNVGFSFTMGHQQGLQYGMRTLANGKMMHGLIAGSCYLHYEKYKGPQANDHWRGIVMKYGVEHGQYDAKFISLDSLCQRYEGMRLREFMRKEDRHVGI